MIDGLIPLTQFIIWLVTILGGLLCGVTYCIEYQGMEKKGRLILHVIMVLALTALLWVPWVVWAVRSVNTWNMDRIERMFAPPVPASSGVEK